MSDPARPIGSYVTELMHAQKQWQQLAEGVRFPGDAVQDLLKATRSPVADLIKTLDVSRSIGTTDAVARSVNYNRSIADTVRGIDSVMAGQAYTRSVMDSARLWRDIAESTRFPRTQWSDLLQTLRVATGNAAAIDHAEVELDTVEKSAPEEPAEVSWLYRLPLIHQVGLLLVALELLDSAGKFLGDATGEEVPPEIQSATQVLFKLVALMILVVQLRTKPPDDNSPT